jgi:signal peptidase I
MTSASEVVTEPAAVANHRRRPWVALVLSWFCPGLGHLYAGTDTGAIIALWVALVAITVWTLLTLTYSGPFTGLALWIAPIVQLVAIPLHAWLLARHARNPYTLRPFNRWHWYVAAWIGWATLGGLVLLLRGEVVEAFKIPSGSMEPSVLVGDFIYVDKRPRNRSGVERGTIVVFMSTEETGMKVLKRVVGVPGDTLAMEQGVLFLNGAALTEAYAVHIDETKSEDPLQRDKMKHWQAAFLTGPSGQDYQPDINDWGPLLVPDSAYFLLGDNRDASYDSRYYGFIPEENIIGRPRVIYWSYDPASYMPLPSLFAIRWSRIGQALN